MTKSINYGHLMHQAMRGLLTIVLRDVAENGLPGAHHFFIAFDTQAEGVDIPDWLVERYPEEMTIVMQEWFDELVVTDDQFAVTLNFGDDEVRMVIPFDAIRSFVDPSVEFGLRFEATDTEDEIEAPLIEVEDDAPEVGDAEIVSLDSFRK